MALVLVNIIGIIGLFIIEEYRARQYYKFGYKDGCEDTFNYVRYNEKEKEKFIENWSSNF